MKNLMKSLLLTLILALTTSGAMAETGQQDFLAQMEKTRARLQLTDEQVEQITPVMENHLEQTQIILSKYGIDLDNRGQGERKKLGLSKARQLGKELKTLRAKTTEELSQYLTEKQMATWQDIQQERRQQIRDRIKNR